MFFAKRKKHLYKEYYSIKRNKSSFCFAPNNTLRFSATGQVHICCRNRYKIVGKYPDNSIDEIWNSNEIAEIRQKLRNYDLSDGCQYCEYMLKTKNFNFLKSLDYDMFQQKKENIIRKFEFELSNKCNLQCGMCFGELSSSIRKNIEKLPEIPNPYNDEFASQLIPYWKNIKRATFAGGEPFLIDIYYKIWEDILNYNPDIEIIIITNGTILNDKIKNLIERGKFFFAVSIDSFNKETYENIRLNAYYEKMINNFDYFYKYSVKNNRWITVNICPLQQNWKEIPEIISNLNKQNISVYFNQVDFPINYSFRGLSLEKIDEIINYYNSYKILKYDNSVTIQNISNFNALLKSLKSLKSLKNELESKSSLKAIKISNKEEAKEQLKFIFKQTSKSFTASELLVSENLIKIDNSFKQLSEDNAVNGVENLCLSPDYFIFSFIVFTTEEKLAQALIKSDFYE